MRVTFTQFFRKASGRTVFRTLPEQRDAEQRHTHLGGQQVGNLLWRLLLFILLKKKYPVGVYACSINTET